MADQKREREHDLQDTTDLKKTCYLLPPYTFLEQVEITDRYGNFLGIGYTYKKP